MNRRLETQFKLTPAEREQLLSEVVLGNRLSFIGKLDTGEIFLITRGLKHPLSSQGKVQTSESQLYFGQPGFVKRMDELPEDARQQLPKHLSLEKPGFENRLRMISFQDKHFDRWTIVFPQADSGSNKVLFLETAVFQRLCTETQLLATPVLTKAAWEAIPSKVSLFEKFD